MVKPIFAFFPFLAANGVKAQLATEILDHPFPVVACS